MNRQKKAFVIVPPAFGHINPISGLVYELLRKSNGNNEGLNLTVIFYGNEENRQAIERTGAQFRKYEKSMFDTKDLQKDITRGSKNMMFFMLDAMLTFSHQILPSLIRDVEREQPDLIVYDQLFMPAKYMLEILAKRPLAKRPKCVMFYPSFAMNEQIVKQIPGHDDKNLMTLVYMVSLFVKQFLFNVYYGTWHIWHPLQIFTKKNDRLNIVAVYPELQPERDMFDDTYRFVGPCIEEKVRNYEVDDADLRRILDEHQRDGQVKLIYVSFGTIFNQDVQLFEKIIDAFREFDDERRGTRKIRADQIQAVISTGDVSYDRLQEKINTGAYRLPANVSLFRSVPQLELLKRAALFITHAGQNSASETIQYGVPVICIPIFADQPMVAHRLCHDLKLGIQFDHTRLQVNELADGIEEMLTNDVYAKNMKHATESSRKCDGVRTSASLIFDFLNSDQDDKKTS